jgi:flavin-dependent dehydrogenase
MPVHIVGAGPAGLSAALAARGCGAVVVVHEKHRDVGARFHGDFQGLENWSRDEDVLAELGRQGIAADFDHTPVYEIVCFDSAGVAHRLSSTCPIFYLVRRGPESGSLDHGLKTQAAEAGVTIRFDDRLEHLEGPGVIAEGPHRADVIAAGYVFETEMASGCYAVLSDRLAPSGYSYLLVDGGRGTVAACLFRDFHQERLYVERTVEFFRDHAGLRWHRARRFGGTGNFGRVGTTTGGPRLYAGEAAAFQDALFGFGLRYALVSGHFAGRAAARGRSDEFTVGQARLATLSAAGLANRWLYDRLGEVGRRLVLAHVVAGRDPRRVLGRLYRPALWKSALAQVIPGPAPLPPEGASPDCNCTWCRCRRERAPAEVTG